MNSKASPYMWAMVRMDTSFSPGVNPSGQGRSGGWTTYCGREHHAFGRAGGAGCVVDHGQFFRFLRAVVYILDSQFPGVLGGKQGLQPGCGFRENRVAGGDHGIISHGDDPVQRRHTRGLCYPTRIFPRTGAGPRSG